MYRLTVADWDSMGRIITQTRGQAFRTLGRAFSQPTHQEFLIIWSVKSSPLTSNNSPELVSDTCFQF